MNNIVFLALIFELHFVLKVKSSFGVVVKIEVDCRSYLCKHIDLKVHVKVQARVASLAFAQCKVFVSIVEKSEFYLCISARSDVYCLSSEYGLKQFAVDFQLRDKAAQTSVSRSGCNFRGHGTIFPIVVNHLVQVVVLIFRKGQNFSLNHNVACLFYQIVFIVLGRILHSRCDILGRSEIERTFGTVVYRVSEVILLSHEAVCKAHTNHCGKTK